MDDTQILNDSDFINYDSPKAGGTIKGLLSKPKKDKKQKLERLKYKMKNN